jgi:hypothetical protein
MNTLVAPARSLGLFAAAFLALVLAAPSRAQMPRVGQSAKNFTLEAHGGGKVSLVSALRRGGPVVLVVLRGYPGYQ